MFSLVFTFLFSLLHTITESKLLFVFEHIRHGARGPWKDLDLTTYKDIFEEVWKGLGELTPSGLRMHYLLGVRNRNKYKSFISPNFNANEMLVYSTDVNRTIMSVYAHLQGMFPTGQVLSDEQLKHADIPGETSKEIEEEKQKLGKMAIKNGIEVFPVHIFDTSKRLFSLNENKVCPGAKTLKEETFNLTTTQETLHKLCQYVNDTFGEYLFKYFDIHDPDYYFSRENIYRIGDNFLVDFFDRREMEALKKTGVDMEALYKAAVNISMTDTYELELRTKNEKLSIMGMSPTFRSLIEWMDKRIQLDKDGKTDEITPVAPKMVIYSGHDTTLAQMSFFMEQVFGVKSFYAGFAANQFFELSKENDKYFINYNYNDESDFSMEYSTFKSKILETIWTQDEINDFCDEISSFTYFMISTYILAGVVAILIALSIYGFVKRKKSKKLSTLIQ